VDYKKKQRALCFQNYEKAITPADLYICFSILDVYFLLQQCHRPCWLPIPCIAAYFG